MCGGEGEDEGNLLHEPAVPERLLNCYFSLEIGGTGYIASVNVLTKQEQMALCLIVLLLLTGWAVKTWRTAHPAAAAPLAQKG
jgi:hypothetical protein